MTAEVVVRAAARPVVIVALSPLGGSMGVLAEVAPHTEYRAFVHGTQELLVSEQVDVPSSGEPILQFFAWAHLPENLQVVSRPFAALAALIVSLCPRNAERSVALRKLLEAKDAAVRAALMT